MWTLCLLLSAVPLGVLCAMAWVVRSMALEALLRVRTREPDTLKEIRFVAYLLRGDLTRLQLARTKDRRSAQGRKPFLRAVKAKAKERAQRKAALQTIRAKMGHVLRRRREARADAKRGWFW
jgi:hypothetical protein